MINTQALPRRHEEQIPADKRVSFCHQGFDQPRFAVVRKGHAMQRENCLRVGGRGGPDMHHASAMSGASSCFMPTT